MTRLTANLGSGSIPVIVPCSKGRAAVTFVPHQAQYHSSMQCPPSLSEYCSVISDFFVLCDIRIYLCHSFVMQLCDLVICSKNQIKAVIRYPKRMSHQKHFTSKKKVKNLKAISDHPKFFKIQHVILKFVTHYLRFVTYQ